MLRTLPVGHQRLDSAADGATVEVFKVTAGLVEPLQ